MTHIIVFGTSIEQGFYDTENGGWVERLKSYLNEKTMKSWGSASEIFYAVFNLGIAGETSEGILKRFDTEVEPRLSSNYESLIIFSFGINDAQQSNSQDSGFKVSIEKFEENVGSLINKTKDLGARPVFVGLSPVDEAQVAPIPWAPEYSYLNEPITRYNEVIKNICLEKGLLFIDVLSVFNQLDYKELLIDGVHPNTDGHRKLFEILKNELQSASIIT